MAHAEKKETKLAGVIIIVYLCRPKRRKLKINRMKNHFLLLLMLALTAMPAMGQTMEPNLKWGKPTNEELTMTTYAPDKDAEAVELYRMVDVQYAYINDDFKVIHRVKERLKVLKEEGKQVGDVSITYRENESNHLSKEVVMGLKATAYNMENGKLTKTKMESSMVHEERLDKNEKRIKFSVPQVKVGTVIEYEYRIESDFYYDLRDWYAQKEIPVLYSKYVLTVPEWFSFSIDQTGTLPMEHQKNYGSLMIGQTSITTNEDSFTARNLPALKDDNFVWHAEDYGCKVTHELRGIYVPGAIHKNYTSKWEDIDKILLDDEEFGGRIKKSSPLKADIAAAGIPAISDPAQRAAAVWQLLKSRVRWNGDYDFWAKSGSKVLKEGTGSNADINFLYINMLHDAGLEADPVVLRLRSKGRLPLTHASLKYLSTFVVGIALNDSTSAYFDASAEDGYLNVLPPVLLVDMARVIRKGRPGEWIDLRGQAEAKQVTVIQAGLDDSGTVSGRYISSYYGNAAARVRRQWREAEDSTEIIRQLQDDNGVDISNYRQEGSRDFSNAASESCDFSRQCPTAEGLIYLNPLVFVPIRKSPFKDATRDLPVEFPFKQHDITNVNIQLPEGWQIEDLPRPQVLKFDGVTLRFVYLQNGNTLSMQYRMDITRTLFSKEQYQELKSIFDQAVENCKTILTLKKTS